MARASIVEEFIRNLQAAERSGNPRDLVEMFDANAELANLTRTNTHSKTTHKDSALHFWRQYLAAFESVQTEFTHQIDNGHAAVLEWWSRGLLSMGTPVRYNGVTVIEYEDGRILRLRTYYDSAALLPHAVSATKTHSESVGRPEITAEATS